MRMSDFERGVMARSWKIHVTLGTKGLDGLNGTEGNAQAVADCISRIFKTEQNERRRLQGRGSALLLLNHKAAA